MSAESLPRHDLGVWKAVRDEVAHQCRVCAARACSGGDHEAPGEPGEQRDREPLTPPRAELDPDAHPDGAHVSATGAAAECGEIAPPITRPSCIRTCRSAASATCSSCVTRRIV